jgi:hypothetical protein
MPNEPDKIPALVVRVQLPSQSPRVNGGPPVPNNITQADINRLNSDKAIESSERNRAGQVSGFAALNNGLTFSAISTSSFANSSYMRSRKVGE